jgi:hypothetical protein
MSEPLWTKNPSILFSADTWQKFVPTKDMDVPTALNSVVRFTVYSSVLLYVATQRKEYIMAIPVVLATTVVFAQIFPTTRALVETFGGKSEKSVRFTMPSAENPFMNPLLTEIGDNPNRGDAAPINRTDVKREVEKAYQQTSEMYMDTSDRFTNSQSIRQFYTMQSAKIPNDQDGFLQFLAKGLDEPDHSSAPLARNAKAESETYVEAKGSVKSLSSSTDRPTGTLPSGSPAPFTPR